MDERTAGRRTELFYGTGCEKATQFPEEVLGW